MVRNNEQRHIATIEDGNSLCIYRQVTEGVQRFNQDFNKNVKSVQKTQFWQIFLIKMHFSYTPNLLVKNV